MRGIAEVFQLLTFSPGADVTALKSYVVLGKLCLPSFLRTYSVLRVFLRSNRSRRILPLTFACEDGGGYTYLRPFDQRISKTDPGLRSGSDTTRVCPTPANFDVNISRWTATTGLFKHDDTYKAQSNGGVPYIQMYSLGVKYVTAANRGACLQHVL